MAGRKIRRYWMSPPSQAQVKMWFSDNRIKSYAILCGKVSGNLFILDFDDQTEFHSFRRRFHKIANTFTVKTKRGYHVYLRSDQTVKTQKIRGGDLQGEGSYAVGPGSTINETQYEIDTYRAIYKVTRGELKELLDIICLPRQTESKQQDPDEDSTQNNITIEKMIKQFKRLSPKRGRNNALYQVAITARALNIPLKQIISPLTNAYMNEKPHWAHQAETIHARIAEAKRTIQSAYNKKTSTNNTQATATGILPTALREEMIKATTIKNKRGLPVNGSTILGRLLEALLLEGIKAKTAFTIKDAQIIGLKYRISTKSVYKILRQEQGISPTGERVFRIVKQPPHVGDNDNRTIKKHYNLAGQEVRQGRPTLFRFIMPNIDELCSMYHVIPQSWDRLEPTDLMSSKAYKEAIHRDYIRRCSPEQSVIYMASRLGCHPRSIYRYDKNLNVKAIPIFGFIPVTWTNVDHTNLYNQPRTDGITPGKWLQRDDGKRFPSIKGIALRQLAQGETLIACERCPSRRLLSQSAISEFNVIWRRLDLPLGEWDVEGKPYDLPAFDSDIKALSTPELAHVMSIPTTLSKTRQANLNRSQKEHSAPHPILNNTLTLIPGIGQSRQNQLYDLGILSLTDLVNANPQQLSSAHWYGGYVTIQTIYQWQKEAAILLGWQKRDPIDIERENHKYTIQIYHKYLKRLLKYVDKTCILMNSIFPMDDLPNIEPTSTYVRLKTLDRLCKQNQAAFYNQSRKPELHQLATNFFAFYRGYINNILCLQDWELEAYGFGDRTFWIRQYKHLERIEINFRSFIS